MLLTILPLCLILFVASAMVHRCVSKEDLDAGISVLKDLNFCSNHNGTDTKGRPIYAADGPGVCRKLPLDLAFSAMLRADIENDCAWLAAAGIMDYSLLVGTGRLEFDAATKIVDSSALLPGVSGGRPTSMLRRKSASNRKISTLQQDGDLEGDCSPSGIHPLCRENSLHSSYQNIVQSVPWHSVWQEHWVSGARHLIYLIVSQC